jgi:2-keto-3-deoxy-L-rhamnonate aldolase RhmA
MRTASFGTFFELGGRGVMEALGHAGLDYVIIDTEHGPFSEETTADLIVAAENCRLLPFVRIGTVTRPAVLRMLDIGARGLIVPNIRSLDQVKELVDYARFPPLGRRGYCPNRTTGWGTDPLVQDVSSYMSESNRRCKLIPQCETRESLEQIEEIAALPGVDGIFIGPCDLSIDLGIPLQFDHPLLTASIERILSACRESGKESYIFAGNLNDAIKWADYGFDSVTFSLDASVFIQAYRKLLQEFRRGDRSGKEKGPAPQVRRITHFETIFQELQKLVSDPAVTLAALDAYRAKADELASYYAGDEWKRDFADDEAGLLPRDLQRGILSEDGIYNLLEEYRDRLTEAGAE